MRSIVAALRTLVLPFGATGGRRIILDGIAGTITTFYDSGEPGLTIGAFGNASNIEFSTGHASENTTGQLNVFRTIDDRGGYLLQPPDMGGGTVSLQLVSRSGDGTIDSVMQISAESLPGDIAIDLGATDDYRTFLVADEIVYGTKTGSGDPPTMETWHQIGAGGEPAFGTNWANNAVGQRNAAFRRTPDGCVQLAGNVKTTANVSTGSQIFTLPVGYRPDALTIFPATFNNPAVAASVVIATTGVVSLNNFSGSVTIGGLPLNQIKFTLAL